MSHFYGTIEGQAGPATRRGSQKSGLKVTAASWKGAITVELYVDAQGRDRFKVHERPWVGVGLSRLIAQGILGGQENDVGSRP